MKLWMRAYLLALPLALAVLFSCAALLLVGSHRDMMRRENQRALGEHAMLSAALAAHLESVGEAFSQDEALRRRALGSAASNYARHYTGGDVALNVAGGQDGELLFQGMSDAQLAAMALPDAAQARQTVTRSLDGRLLLFVSGWSSAGAERYRVDLMRDVTQLADALRDYAWRAAALVFAASLVLGAGLWLVLTVATRPLASLTRRVEILARGDYESPFPEAAGEVGALSGAFADMGAQVRSHVRELEQAKRDREAFIANLAHEMKTPMTTVIGYSDLLLRANLSDEQRRHALTAIRGEGARLDALSRKLLRLFSIEDGQALQPQEVKVSELLEAVRDAALPRLLQAGVSVDVAHCPGSLRVDRDLVEALLHNLIENAVRASEAGMAVKIGFDGKSLFVQDEGAGIPEAEIERVKQPFYSLDKQRASGGTGLGLTLCDAIARAHGARLLLESSPGRGTTAWVIFDKSLTMRSAFGNNAAV